MKKIILTVLIIATTLCINAITIESLCYNNNALFICTNKVTDFKLMTIDAGSLKIVFGENNFSLDASSSLMVVYKVSENVYKKIYIRGIIEVIDGNRKTVFFVNDVYCKNSDAVRDKMLELLNSWIPAN